MRPKIILILFKVVSLSVLFWSALAWAVCPEFPNDNGLCDTLYEEVYPPDATFTNPGHLARAPFFVTHDVPNPEIDSISAIIIPLRFTHTNPTKYCSVSTYWNRISWSQANLPRSIFRHLVTSTGDTIHNWMMDQYEEGQDEEWNDIQLNLDGTSHFWLSMIPAGSEDQRFGPEIHRLLATITFKLQDTMLICIDTCWWPPNNRLAFARSDAIAYIPRHNMPYCFSIRSANRGDANSDGVINVGDVIYLINYLFKGGPVPNPQLAGDANCDGTVDVGDVIYLINYLFKGGAPPCE